MLACGLTLLGACSAPAPAAGILPPASQAGSQKTLLQGLLLLRGSAPHAQAVLQTSAGELWELQGLNQQQIDHWQRQRVQVQGEPAPMTPPAAGATGMQRPPQLRVESIRGLP
ncbi:hypothetical protein GCM10010975_33880 [Comamonas phosphati]|nr:hypothetical protein GCM10010975_33880 [Comamonas phosphati]